MTDETPIYILPYTRIFGQDQLKLALEIAYIAPSIGGVLICGECGTGKSTMARAFAQMVYNHLPVTIPINATEDRVVGGWQISELIQGQAIEQMGLLEEAKGKLLYIDEVNLLDDHIVNIILDATSTGILVVQRDGHNTQKKFDEPLTLVGTMNPEEGSLRPQLLDRFGLMVEATAKTDPELRCKILRAVLDFDIAVFRRKHRLPDNSHFLENAAIEVQNYKASLETAKNDFYNVEVSDTLEKLCVSIARLFQVTGHRGDYILCFAACACAARRGRRQVTREDVTSVAPLVLQHRRSGAKQLNSVGWNNRDQERLEELLANYE